MPGQVMTLTLSVDHRPVDGAWPPDGSRCWSSCSSTRPRSSPSWSVRCRSHFAETWSQDLNTGPALRVAIAAGKFHGVTSTAMPTGCWRTMIRLAPDGAVISSPDARTASSAYQRKNSAAYAVSPRASAAPCRSPARSGGRARRRARVISSKARRRISARSRGAVAAQPSAAASAASTRGDGVVDGAVGDGGDHLAGRRVETSKRPPSEAATVLPPMQRSSGRSAIWSRAEVSPWWACLLGQ